MKIVMVRRKTKMEVLKNWRKTNQNTRMKHLDLVKN
jgi:hypothetical protein